MRWTGAIRLRRRQGKLPLLASAQVHRPEPIANVANPGARIANSVRRSPPRSAHWPDLHQDPQDRRDRRRSVDADWRSSRARTSPVAVPCRRNAVSLISRKQNRRECRRIVHRLLGNIRRKRILLVGVDRTICNVTLKGPKFGVVDVMDVIADEAAAEPAHRQVCNGSCPTRGSPHSMWDNSRVDSLWISTSAAAHRCRV